MKFKDMAQLSIEERRIKQRELELELIKLNTQVATGTPPKNAGTVSRIKKDIARLMLIGKLSEASAAKPAGKALRSTDIESNVNIKVKETKKQLPKK